METGTRLWRGLVRMALSIKMHECYIGGEQRWEEAASCTRISKTIKMVHYTLFISETKTDRRRQ